MKPITILIIFLLISSCKTETSTEVSNEKQKDSANLPQISRIKSSLVLGKISEINLGETVTVTGLIDVPPKNKAVISTFIGGYIVNTPLLVGDKVSKGQLLVSLEDPEYVELQQNYLELSEGLTYLQSEFNRQKTLLDEKITSEKTYLKAQSIYKSTLARFNGLKKKLQMLNINTQSVNDGQIVSKINLYAPIEGHVTKINVSNGTYVSGRDIIMEIVDTDHIHLELSVFEKDIMRVKKGQKITFQIPEVSTAIFNAKVHLIGTTVDEGTRRVKVHGHVDNENNDFKVGMYVTAKILLSDQLVYGVPKSAIGTNEKGSFVYVVKNASNQKEVFQKVEVIIGKTNENYTEIENPESLIGKTLVLKGMEALEI